MSLLLAHLALDLFAVVVLVSGIYRRGEASRDFAFSCIMLNLVTFSLVWLMNDVSLDLGLGLGLFAIFGILRYRTEALGIRDLTYLFVAIGLAVLNGMEPGQVDHAQLLGLDAVCVLGAAAFDRLRRVRPGRRVPVSYDRLELVHPAQHEALLADLRDRLGLDVVSVDVRRVDLLQDTATLDVFVAPESDR